MLDLYTRSSRVEGIAQSGTPGERMTKMETPSTQKKTKVHSNKPNTDPARWAKRHRFSVESDDLLRLDGHWYVTHSGLIRLARRSHCAGIHVEPVAQFSDP